jgi:glycosyltransferase involved in cell wall biosynthesis
MDSPSVHVYQLWHRLRAMGYEVHTWGGQAVPGGIEHPRTEEGLRDLLNRVELLYVRFPFEYYWTPRCMARLLTKRRLPVVCEFNAPLYEFTRDMPWTAPWAIRKRTQKYARNHLMVRACVDQAVCTCEELAGYARRHFGLRHATVVADGADPEQFHPGLRAEGRRSMGVTEADFVVFWAGITKYGWQGTARMIAAADRLHGTEVRFVLAGDRRHLPEELPENVMALGHVPYFEMPKYTAGADVCLCIYDDVDWCPIGFYRSPLKLFEYMASGRPVIASRMGQIARVIRDGENGYLTDGSPDDIAEKIDRLRRDRDRADAMGRAARETVLQGYTWQGAAERTDRIISGLIGRSTCRRPTAMGDSRRRRKEQKSPLRLGFFSTYGGYGGTEEYLDKLMRGACTRGHEVVFFHHKNSPDQWVEQVAQYAETASFNRNGVVRRDVQRDSEAPEARHSPLWNVMRRAYRGLAPQWARHMVWFLREARRVSRVLASHRVDAVHFSDLGAEPGIVAARLAGIRRVSGALNCMPNTSGFCNRMFYRLLETLCLGCVDGAAAVSHHGRQLWLRRLPVNPRKVGVIHNSTELVDLAHADRVACQVRRECGVPPDARVVGVSATLARRKGHRYLLEAFPEVLREVPDAWLMLAGDGPCRGELEALAGELGIDGRVAFLGHRTDMDRVVHAYDVVALTSVAIESLPFALLEGMACEKPAIGTAVGGMPELIEDGVTGRVVPPRDVAGIAEGVVEVLRDPARTRQMGKAARRRVAEHFHSEQMVRDTLALMFSGQSPGEKA